MAGKFSLTAALLLLCLASTQGAWSVISSEIEKSSVAGVEPRHLVLNESGSTDEATLDLAFFSTKSATLRVIDNPKSEDDLARPRAASARSPE
jgi:hypothetical protein